MKEGKNAAEVLTSEDIFTDPVCLEFRTASGAELVRIVDEAIENVCRLESVESIGEIAPYDAAGAVVGLPLRRSYNPPRERSTRPVLARMMS